MSLVRLPLPAAWARPCQSSPFTSLVSISTAFLYSLPSVLDYNRHHIHELAPHLLIDTCMSALKVVRSQHLPLLRLHSPAIAQAKRPPLGHFLYVLNSSAASHLSCLACLCALTSHYSHIVSMVQYATLTMFVGLEGRVFFASKV